MSAGRPILALISLILLAGAILLHFFVLLAGAVNGRPVNFIYFLQADTSGISGAPATSRWTFWNVDGVDGNGYTIPSSVHPAWPLDPPNNFGTSTGVPAGFVGTKYYYYMTRFMFAFNLIALFFMVVALITGLLAICSRLGSKLSGLMTVVAFVFEALTAALMTTAYVKGRNLFNSNNQTATLGHYAFGFMWACVVCLLLATIFFFIGGGMKHKDEYSSGGRFSRKRSTRSRGSFIDTDSQRPVVQEV